MKLLRASIIGLFLSATSASHAVEKIPVIETIEDQAISAMVSRNIKNFLVMNEKTGTLKFIRDGKVYLTSPAISGSVKGDDVTKDTSVTRSGIFILQHIPDKNSFEYFRHGSDVYLVHPSAGAE
ncbi:MAG TPA: hypothetical protein PKH37_09180, partial [Alphaproteobacteria bacterium]|nr:hypothetical protein [Alphaproteobacteria bacterium]